MANIELYKNYYIIKDILEEDVSYERLSTRFSNFDFKEKKLTMSGFLHIRNEFRIPNTVDKELLRVSSNDEMVIKDLPNFKPSEDFDLKLTSNPKDKLQEEAIDFVVNSSSVHRLVSISTGKGKTFVSIASVVKLKMKPLIIVDRVSTGEQWINEFLKFTNIKEDEIEFLDGQKLLKEKYNKNTKLFIITHSSLNSIIKTDYKAIQKLIDDCNIRIKIFDEAHAMFQNMCQVNTVSDTDVVLYLSATMRRSYKEQKFLDNMFSVVDKYINLEDFVFRTFKMYQFNSKPNSYQTRIVHSKRGMSGTRWGNIILDKYQYNGFYYIFGVVERIIRDLNIKNNDENKIAIVLPLNAMIDALAEKFNQRNYDYAIFTAETRKEKSLGEIFQHKYILTNEKIFNKAINDNRLTVLINFVPLSDHNILKQLMGRLRYVKNRNSYYIDVADAGYEAFAKQQRVRSYFFKKHAINVEELKAKAILIENF